MGQTDRRTPGQKAASANRGRRKEDKRRRTEQRAAALGIHVDEMKRRDAIAADARRSKTAVHVPVNYGSSKEFGQARLVRLP
jgi:hypothetical protein